MLDTPPQSPSAIAQVKNLQEELARLSTKAKDEALAQATQAVEILDALGLPYRLVDESAARHTKQRKKRTLDCKVCDYTTDPPHNARKHKGQGEDKQPFTEEELAELGLKRVEQ